MKKIFGFLVALLVMSTGVFAVQQGGQGDGIGEGSPEIMPYGQGEGDQGEMMGDTVRAQERIKAQSPEELRQMIQQKQQMMNQEMQSMGAGSQEVYKNQNRVRIAVHSLLAMEDLGGNKGQEISRVAREFNNSVQATIKAEEKVQNRGALARLFAGGDHETAGELEKQVEQNRQKIQELKQLKEECDCEEEVKAMMQEQIQNMEQEQARLGELAQKEKESKGLFGWIWK